MRQIEEFRMLDLFSGAGGVSYGMEKNSMFKTVIALDNDAVAAQTFKRNMPDSKVVVGDITDEKVKKEVITLSRKLGVNMIIGGPPCQGFSNKGKKLGLDDSRNFLFREFLEFVECLEPEVFVIENVRGILTTSNGWFRDQIIHKINDLGYYVNYGILNSRDFGVPQSRERAFFICSKSKMMRLPKETTSKHRTVRDAIEDLAYLNSGEGDEISNYVTEPLSSYQRYMRKDSKHLFNHKASNHKQIAIEKLKMIPPEKGKEYLPKDMLGKQLFKSTWGRLKWDEPSPTIDTRFDAASNGTNNHPFLHRAITPREAARLQSFDDRFIFLGAKVHIRKQIGNAVPPLLAKAIADQISKEYLVIEEE